ncbi:uncharacterized protein N7503_012049 [Penicillium pulvis]|uniref:uncharacterized protein n=1 Tax=Penicillium pulvis TaxID=1562058 RepID=UPI00254983AF|nr:uncharacterized protein N7503_012049 [Penicillium pulvis]KAJ5786837.1 hypothetical protein N7503_012049 [Penicillium pulvis]
MSLPLTILDLPNEVLNLIAQHLDAFRGSQAWLFGIEGYADIKTIESQIFGARLNCLRWSPYGSSPSRHDPDGPGEEG